VSREDVEVVRRVYEAAASRNRETVYELYDPDVVLDFSQVPMGRLLGQDVYRGHDGLRSMFRAWHQAWDRVEYDFETLIDAGEHVIAVVKRHARGRASGVEVEWPVALVWTLSHGRVVRVAWFSSLEEAREAAGVGGMSANVELVRSILADWERGDYSNSQWAHPEIEYVIADGPAAGRWTGLDGMATAARANLDAWEDFRFQGDEYRELDDERVLVLVHWVGRGKRSGAHLEQIRSTGAQLFHLRDGQVTKFVHYWDRDRALDDLGLTPEVE
jgi:ketosteroid isomerase-like protein